MPDPDRSDSNVDPTLPRVPGGAPARPEPDAREPVGDPTVLHGDPATAPAGGAGVEPTAASPGARKPAVSEASGRLDRAGEVIADRFEVVKTLGEGGMGRVYQVRDRQIEGRQVALKVLRDRFSRNAEFRKLFFQEIKTAQKFVSEHVNQVRDVGQMEDGRLFLTMDLVDGEPLADLIERERTLTERHALEIARQILLALASGHEHGFLHRDVKPENVILSARVPKTEENPFGIDAKLLDFGIAGLAAEVSDGTIAGTPTYMSPEQAQGQRLDARSDLFAVGIVIYEMLSGSRPFRGKTVDEIVTSVVETRVEPLIAELEHLSKPVQKLLTKALAKDRDKRYQSATEFVAAIEASSAYRLPREVPPWLWAVAGTLLVAAVAEGFLIFDQHKRLELLRDGGTERFAGVTEKHQAALTEKDRRINALSEQIAGLEAGMLERQTRIEDLSSQLGEVARTSIDEGAKERDEAGELKARLTTVETRLELQEDELADVRSERERLQRQNERQEEELTALRRKLGEFEQLQNPLVQKAAGFDRIYGQLEQGFGESAAEIHAALRGDGVFGGRKDAEFLTAMVEAAAAMQRFERDGDAAQLLRAEERLAEARELRPAFGAVAAEWLDSGDPGDEPRLARADAALAALEDRVVPARVELAARSESMWDELVARGPEQDPSDAIRHAAMHGPALLDELTASVAGHLESAYESGGVLDVERVLDADFLDVWAVHLNGLGGDAGARGRAILDFWCARRWYDGDPADEDLVLDRLAPGPVAAPVEDWRGELFLEHELYRRGAFPPGPGRMSVYRVVRPNGSVIWRKDSGVSEGSEGRTVEQRMFRDDAAPLGEPLARVWERRGKAWAIAGTTQSYLDLGAPASSTRLEPFPTVFDGKVPPQLGVSPQQLQQFRAEIEAGPAACLVVGEDGTRRWFSPDYGLVREESSSDKGVTRLELVFASPNDR